MASCINLETGEVFDNEELSNAPRRLRSTSITKYVGSETKWPTECLTEDHLLESLSQLDSYLSNRPEVNYQLLNEHLTEGCTTQAEWTMLNWLCHALTGWNYWIGNVSELQRVLPTAAQTSRAIQGLTDKGLIRILHKDRPDRGNRVILVSPMLAWKGAYAFRNNSQSRWYT